MVMVTVVVKTWTWLRVAGLLLGLSFSACATGNLISLGNLSWNTNDDTLREVRFFLSLLLSLITGVVLPVASLAVVHVDTGARDGDWSLCKLRKYLHPFRLSRSSATSSTYVFSLPHCPCPHCTVEKECQVRVPRRHLCHGYLSLVAAVSAVILISTVDRHA